jgi:5-methylcytosine-specific restriction endonuclease McrA
MKRRKPRKWNLNGRIRNAIRRMFLFSPLRKTIKDRCKFDNKFKCEICGNITEQIDVDHINPVIRPEFGFEDWNTFVNRLFCEEFLLQGLCELCHSKKTDAEEKLRAFYGTGKTSKKSRESNSSSQKGHHRNLGVPKSDVHKLSMSKERKGKPQTEARQQAVLKVAEERQKPIKAINLVTNEEIYFKSIKDASEYLKISGPNISKVCRKVQNRSQAGGYKFEYYSKIKTKEDNRGIK